MHVFHKCNYLSEQRIHTYIILHDCTIGRTREPCGLILNVIPSLHTFASSFHARIQRGGGVEEIIFPHSRKNQTFSNHKLKLQKICLSSPHPGKQNYPSPKNNLWIRPWDPNLYMRFPWFKIFLPYHFNFTFSRVLSFALKYACACRECMYSLYNC